jgi:preprotein translocase subunit SecG
VQEALFPFGVHRPASTIQVRGTARAMESIIYPSRPMYTVLSVLQVFIAVGLIFLVLLHSGKDAGMSGAFGVGATGGSTGGSLMERNLDRWTIVFALLFVANTIALLKV